MCSGYFTSSIICVRLSQFNVQCAHGVRCIFSLSYALPMACQKCRSDSMEIEQLHNAEKKERNSKNATSSWEISSYQIKLVQSSVEIEFAYNHFDVCVERMSRPHIVAIPFTLAFTLQQCIQVAANCPHTKLKPVIHFRMMNGIILQSRQQ